MQLISWLLLLVFIWAVFYGAIAVPVKITCNCTLAWYEHLLYGTIGIVVWSWAAVISFMVSFNHRYTLLRRLSHLTITDDDLRSLKENSADFDKMYMKTFDQSVPGFNIYKSTFGAVAHFYYFFKDLVVKEYPDNGLAIQPDTNDVEIDQVFLDLSDADNKNVYAKYLKDSRSNVQKRNTSQRIDDKDNKNQLIDLQSWAKKLSYNIYGKGLNNSINYDAAKRITTSVAEAKSAGQAYATVYVDPSNYKGNKPSALTVIFIICMMLPGSFGAIKTVGVNPCVKSIMSDSSSSTYDVTSIEGMVVNKFILDMNSNYDLVDASEPTVVLVDGHIYINDYAYCKSMWPFNNWPSATASLLSWSFYLLATALSVYIGLTVSKLWSWLIADTINMFVDEKERSVISTTPDMSLGARADTGLTSTKDGGYVWDAADMDDSKSSISTTAYPDTQVNITSGLEFKYRESYNYKRSAACRTALLFVKGAPGPLTTIVLLIVLFTGPTAADNIDYYNIESVETLIDDQSGLNMILSPLYIFFNDVINLSLWLLCLIAIVFSLQICLSACMDYQYECQDHTSNHQACTTRGSGNSLVSGVQQGPKIDTSALSKYHTESKMLSNNQVDTEGKICSNDGDGNETSELSHFDSGCAELTDYKRPSVLRVVILLIKGAPGVVAAVAILIILLPTQAAAFKQVSHITNITNKSINIIPLAAQPARVPVQMHTHTMKVVELQLGCMHCGFKIHEVFEPISIKNNLERLQRDTPKVRVADLRSMFNCQRNSLCRQCLHLIGSLKESLKVMCINHFFKMSFDPSKTVDQNIEYYLGAKMDIQLELKRCRSNSASDVCKVLLSTHNRLSPFNKFGINLIGMLTDSGVRVTPCPACIVYTFPTSMQLIHQDKGFAYIMSTDCPLDPSIDEYTQYYNCFNDKFQMNCPMGYVSQVQTIDDVIAQGSNIIICDPSGWNEQYIHDYYGKLGSAEGDPMYSYITDEIYTNYDKGVINDMQTTGFGQFRINEGYKMTLWDNTQIDLKVTGLRSDQDFDADLSLSHYFTFAIFVTADDGIDVFPEDLSKYRCPSAFGNNPHTVTCQDRAQYFPISNTTCLRNDTECMMPLIAYGIGGSLYTTSRFSKFGGIDTTGQGRDQCDYASSGSGEQYPWQMSKSKCHQDVSGAIFCELYLSIQVYGSMTFQIGGDGTETSGRPWFTGWTVESRCSIPNNIVQQGQCRIIDYGMTDPETTVLGMPMYSTFLADNIINSAASNCSFILQQPKLAGSSYLSKVSDTTTIGTISLDGICNTTYVNHTDNDLLYCDDGTRGEKSSMVLTGTPTYKEVSIVTCTPVKGVLVCTIIPEGNITHCFNEIEPKLFSGLHKTQDLKKQYCIEVKANSTTLSTSSWTGTRISTPGFVAQVTLSEPNVPDRLPNLVEWTKRGAGELSLLIIAIYFPWIITVIYILILVPLGFINRYNLGIIARKLGVTSLTRTKKPSDKCPICKMRTYNVESFRVHLCRCKLMQCPYCLGCNTVKKPDTCSAIQFTSTNDWNKHMDIHRWMRRNYFVGAVKLVWYYTKAAVILSCVLPHSGAAAYDFSCTGSDPRCTSGQQVPLYHNNTRFRGHDDLPILNGKIESKSGCVDGQSCVVSYSYTGSVPVFENSMFKVRITLEGYKTMSTTWVIHNPRLVTECNLLYIAMNTQRGTEKCNYNCKGKDDCSDPQKYLFTPLGADTNGINYIVYDMNTPLKDYYCPRTSDCVPGWTHVFRWFREGCATRADGTIGCYASTIPNIQADVAPVYECTVQRMEWDVCQITDNNGTQDCYNINEGHSMIGDSGEDQISFNSFQPTFMKPKFRVAAVVRTGSSKAKGLFYDPPKAQDAMMGSPFSFQCSSVPSLSTCAKQCWFPEVSSVISEKSKTPKLSYSFIAPDLSVGSVSKTYTMLSSIVQCNNEGSTINWGDVKVQRSINIWGTNFQDTVDTHVPSLSLNLTHCDLAWTTITVQRETVASMTVNYAKITSTTDLSCAGSANRIMSGRLEFNMCTLNEGTVTIEPGYGVDVLLHNIFVKAGCFDYVLNMTVAMPCDVFITLNGNTELYFDCNNISYSEPDFDSGVIIHDSGAYNTNAFGSGFMSFLRTSWGKFVMVVISILSIIIFFIIVFILFQCIGRGSINRMAYNEKTQKMD
ncbi:glycoprotein precursor [Wuhan Millipede Virus 2]|uniref:Glycoprotein n=1 Tax=Wuhan Millipede Virus 2 TaxID=1608125 RepID=A0A1L4AAZ4_9VIRU|nr:glycoprotein precursor [Wuhan Millipede Virus 2]API65463.1 glycoprotein precursor [Wuhan Millipede Virus 2]